MTGSKPTSDTGILVTLFFAAAVSIDPVTSSIGVPRKWPECSGSRPLELLGQDSERAPIGDQSSRQKWSYFPALGYGPHRATAPQMAVQTETGSRPICGAPFFPLLPLRGGPLRPRLRKWPCRQRPDRALFAEPLGTPHRGGQLVHRCSERLGRLLRILSLEHPPDQGAADDHTVGDRTGLRGLIRR